MELQLRRSGNSHDAALVGWIGVSLVAHVALLSMGGGIAPSRMQFSLPIVATIQQVTLESISAPAIQDAESVIATPPAQERAAAIAEQRDKPAVSDDNSKTSRSARMAPEASLDLPLPFDGYWGPSDVDVRAEPSNDVLLTYPWVAFMRRQSGVVVMALLINENGGLDGVTVQEATPPGLFERAALEAVSKLHFSPALKNGRPVKSRKTIEVVFDLPEHLDRPATIR